MRAPARPARHARARSSSRTRRTSCARRCSRSPGFLELLDDEDLDESTRRSSSRRRASQVDRLTNLATDLLDLSRMDAGRIRIEHEEVGLAEIARRCARGLLRRSPTRRATRSCSTSTRTPGRSPTRSASSRSRGRCRATRSCTRRRARRCGSASSGAAARVALAVEDDGPGIPREHARARLPALLPRRGRRRRPGAGSGSRSHASSRADGRHGRPSTSGPGATVVHARAAGRRRALAPAAPPAGLRRPFPRGNGAAPRFHVETRDGRGYGRHGYSDPCAPRSSPSPPSPRSSAPASPSSLGSLIGATRRRRRRPSSSRARSPRPTRRPPRVPALGNRFDPAAIYAAPRARRRHALRRSRRRRRVAGLGLRRRREGHDPDERARRHERRREQRRQRQGRREALRRVPRRRPRAGDDRRLGSVQRRRRRPRRPRRPRARRRCRSATRRRSSSATPVAAIGSPFGEQSSLSVGVVSATGPDDRLAHLRLQRRRRDPDRRADQPRQLRRAALRRARARDRHQRPDSLARAATPRASASRSRSTPPSAAARPAAADGQGRLRRTSASRPRTSRPGSRRSSASTRRHGALIAKVEPGTPAARAGLHGGTRTVDYNGLEVSLGGDVIVGIDGMRVAGADDVSRAVARLAAGQQVTFTVLRGGTDRRAVR